MDFCVKKLNFFEKESICSKILTVTFSKKLLESLSDISVNRFARSVVWHKSCLPDIAHVVFYLNSPKLQSWLGFGTQERFQSILATLPPHGTHLRTSKYLLHVPAPRVCLWRRILIKSDKIRREQIKFDTCGRRL